MLTAEFNNQLLTVCLRGWLGVLCRYILTLSGQTAIGSCLLLQLCEQFLQFKLELVDFARNLIVADGLLKEPLEHFKSALVNLGALIFSSVG